MLDLLGLLGDLRGVRAEPATAARLASRTEVVRLGRHVCPLVLQRDGVAVLVDATKRLVDLDELAGRQLTDGTGLDTVLQDLPVATLQTNADAVGDEVRDRRQHDQADAAEPGHHVQRDVEEVSDVVVTTRDGQQGVEDQRHDAEAGADGDVARTLQQVVVCSVTGHLLLDPRVSNQQRDQQAEQQGDPEDRGDGVVTEVQLPCRHDTGCTISPQHVDVRLGTSGDLGWVVRANVPNTVDLEETSQQCHETEGDQAEGSSLDAEDRQDSDADNVVLGATRSRELGVLLEPDQRQVSGDQSQQDARDQQHVRDVQARDDDVAREVTGEHDPVHPGADDRQGDHDCRHDSQTHTGEQVVRQGVAHEALGDRQQQKQAADNPVSLTRLAECTREEDAHHVNHDGHGEQQCCPVVDLANEQATTHLEGDIECRVVSGGHLHTVERCVGAVVDDLRHGWVEEQRQVDTRQDQNDKGVERDLTEHEGPVSREHLVDLWADDPRRGVALIDIVCGLS